MTYDSKPFRLLENKEIADGIFSWTVENRELAPLAKCGQFVNVKVPSRVLRRPISICDADESTLRLVFQVKGEGTRLMSEMKSGDEVELLAPLGHGFEIEEGKRYCFVGGGIGVPPLLFAAKQCKNPMVITGFRNKDLVILQDDFKSIGAETYLATDDGSLEERMGCGIGACLVCSCKTKENDGVHMTQVCRRGPVYKAEEVFFGG